MCMDSTVAVIPVCFYHFDESVAARLTEKDTLRVLQPVVKQVYVPTAAETPPAPSRASAGDVPGAPAPSAASSYRVIHVHSAAGVAVLGRAAGQRLQAGHAQLSIATFDA